jgi:hypothetical protein
MRYLPRSGLASASLALTSLMATYPAAALLPLGQTGLPTTFAGEALIVALAFSFPALAAGSYLAARRLWRSVGVRGGLIVGGVTVASALAVAMVDGRPDLLNLTALSRFVTP